MTLSSNATSSEDARLQRSIAPNDPTTWIIICGIAVIAAIIIGAILAVIVFRERAMQRNEFELENTTHLLAQHFDRQFDEITAAEHFIASSITRLSPAEFSKTISTDSFRTMLQEKVTSSADKSASISIFDRDGGLLVSSDQTINTTANISDRRYFKAIRDSDPNSTDSSQVELVNSRLHNDKRVVLARRISTPDGFFLGLIVCSIPSLDIEQILSTAALERRSILLITHDGDVVARVPRENSSVSPDFLDAFVLQRLGSENAGIIRLLDTQAGDHIIVSARQLSRHRLTVVAATAASTVLSNWNDETLAFLLMASLAAGVASIMLVSIVRYLKEQTRRLDVALNNIPQALMLFDPLQRLIIKNQRYSEMFGDAGNVALGRTLSEILQSCQSKERLEQLDAYRNSVQEALNSRGRTQTTIKIPDGRSLQVVNQALKEGGWVSTIQDVTEQRQAEALMIRLARFDQLTGLFNRRSFLDHLNRQLANRSEQTLTAVLLIDLDEFKSVNDTLGHYVGDSLLKSIGLELIACLTSGEYVARLGGDEFAIVSSQVSSRDDAVELAARAHGAIRRSHDCGGHNLTIDASIGIALAPNDGVTCDGIVQSADLAMYAAKAHGKGNYKFFEPDMEAKAKERLQLEAELRTAITQGQIIAHFQPIYDLSKRRIVCCEALARWEHRTRGSVSPVTFIPIAEQAGLINQLGDVILRQACHSAMDWPDDVAVAVNVSPIQLQNPVFSLRVISALYDSGLAARRLEIEITEAVLISDDEAALKTLHDLRTIGVRIALDDFGTGYSSLSYLLRFPFDKLKIDRSFVNDLADQDKSLGIIRGAIAMASELKMVVTAEGVESEIQRDALSKLYCDQIQGYLISPPMAGDKISELLHAPAEMINNR